VTMASIILVTGGTGFIGRHLVARIATGGNPVRVLSRHGASSGGGPIEQLTGDFTRAEDIAPALRDVDVVFHLAATTTPGEANRRILYDARTNLLGSLELIQAASDAGVRRFIFVSSGGSLYGPTARRPVAEEGATEPLSCHGVSKLAIEKYLQVYGRERGLEYRVARGANAYGEGQDPARGQGFVAYALGQLAREEPITVWGDGSVVRDYIYVGDLVRALELMARDEADHRVYNVGTGQGHSLLEMIPLLEKITGRRAELRFVAGRAADVPYNRLDIGRIRAALGWEPEVTLEEGLRRTWAWIQTHHAERAKLTRFV